MAAAPLPKSIKVGPVTYPVYVGGPEWDQARLREKVDGLLGLADAERGQITLSADMSPGVQRETLWHEVFHAVCQVGGYLVSRVERDDLEENVIRTVSPWLLGVLRDNPGLVAYLTDA